MTDADRSAAPRPVLMTVDDDADVLRAIERDLRGRYGRDYRIIRANAAPSALDALQKLRLRDEEVALVLADQRMPDMTGVELLREARDLFPEAKSVLLTAYADTDAAIDAINSVRLDYYVMKPWDPPEERLYPILDELLDEWQATARLAVPTVRVVGDRWSGPSHRLREFLARNLVPFRWVNVESAEGERLLTSTGQEGGLPLLVLEDGSVLADPDPASAARALQLHPRTDTDFFDLIVVGAGPSGLGAAVYGTSEGLSTALVEREGPGGQAGLSSLIENYLGFPRGVSGAELTRRAWAQARRFGTVMFAPCTVVRLERRDPYRILILDDGRELSCRVLVVASGVQYRELTVPGVAELVGAGVYYGAASTEAPSMAGERACVVGGANSAGQAAVHLARYAREVVMIVRADALEAAMSSYLIDQIRRTPNIEVRLHAEVERVDGDGRLECVTLVDRHTQDREQLEAAGLFVFIGARPHTDWLQGVVHRDERGFVVTGSALRDRDRWTAQRDPFLLETSVPGVFAVGDVRARSVKRIASAVGEGAIAVQFIHQYLNV